MKGARGKTDEFVSVEAKSSRYNSVSQSFSKCYFFFFVSFELLFNRFNYTFKYKLRKF